MSHLTKCALLLACGLIVGCDDMAVLSLGGSSGGGNSAREQMVLGSNMSFADCKSRGGLIIRDASTSMVACDPRIIRQNQPTDEEEFIVIEDT